MKFHRGEKAYIVESAIFVLQVEIIQQSSGFCLVKYPQKTGGYHVRESRLFKTKEEATHFVERYKTKE